MNISKAREREREREPLLDCRVFFSIKLKKKNWKEAKTYTKQTWYCVTHKM